MEGLVSTTRGPRVWGIGLTRTGTTSLCDALLMLGYKAVHWPSLVDLFTMDIEAATDETVAVSYKYLDMRFPGSKFIFTFRDINSWLRSTEEHRDFLFDAMMQRLKEWPFPGGWASVLKTDPQKFFYAADRLARVSAARAEDLDKMIADVIFSQMYIYESILFDREKFQRGYERHAEGVARYFRDRSQDVLHLDVCAGEGWDKLCGFLGRDKPDRPFPRENAGAVKTQKVEKEKAP